MTELGKRVLLGLTPTKRRIILALVEDGGSVDKMAATVGLNVGTVKQHLAELGEALDAKGDRVKLVLKLIRHGVVSCPCGANGEPRFLQ